jgi:hypothetical protein
MPINRIVKCASLAAIAVGVKIADSDSFWLSYERIQFPEVITPFVRRTHVNATAVSVLRCDLEIRCTSHPAWPIEKAGY